MVEWVVRSLLFTRGFTQAATEEVGSSHGNGSSTTRRAHLANSIGELVALLALITLAEGSNKSPYYVLLAILCAFFLPRLIMTPVAMKHARRVLFGDAADDLLPPLVKQLLVALAGSLVCYAVFRSLSVIVE